MMAEAGEQTRFYGEELQAKWQELEAARAKERADAEIAALKAESRHRPVHEGRQYSIHALSQLGKAGIEDIILQAITEQVPQSRRDHVNYRKYTKELFEATHELTGLYANGSNNRQAISQAAGKVAAAAGMVGIRPPVRGVEVDGQREW